MNDDLIQAFIYVEDISGMPITEARENGWRIIGIDECNEAPHAVTLRHSA